MYGFNHRYHESVQDALRILRSGELGRVINMRGVYGKAKLTFTTLRWPRSNVTTSSASSNALTTIPDIRPSVGSAREVVKASAAPLAERYRAGTRAGSMS